MLQGRMMAPMRLLFLLLGVLFLSPAAEAGEVGVSYGRVANDLPDPASVVKLLQQSGITSVRLFDADPAVLRAFADTGIKVHVMLQNEDLAAAATSRLFALRWAQCSVAAHYPATRIDGVAVGNEVFEHWPNMTRQLVPAMVNVHLALRKLGLADTVKVSTPIAFTALRDTFPPSAARFRDEITLSVMKPMLEFLARTDSYLSMNPYPFFAYAEDPQNIPLDYALGRYKPGVRDPNTGVVYHSLLDAMMDATFFAVEKLTAQLNIRQPTGNGRGLNWGGGSSTRYSENGWPSGGRRFGKGRLLHGNAWQAAATVANAKAYNNYVINRVLSGQTGTPYRPDADMDVHIFALFNENGKGHGPNDVERHFGLFHSNMTKVYDFDFRGGALTESWCVVDADAGEERLQAALDYACGHGADCRAIQCGGSCFQPDTRLAHASYAVNSYYQRKARAPGTCDFAGAARIVYHQPRFGSCVLPSNDWIQQTASNSQGYAAIDTSTSM